MFGLRLFRFRSLERDRETAGRRLARIQRVVYSAVAEAESESRGLQARVAKARMSWMSLFIQVQERETDPACRAELANLEQRLVAGERSLTQLEDHVTDLRELEQRIERLIDQAQAPARSAPNKIANER
jgi:hypothetical protein